MMDPQPGTPADFNHTYQVQSQDRGVAVALLHPRAMEFLCAHQHKYWWYEGGDLIVVDHGDFPPEHLSRYVADVTGLAALMPGFLRTDYGRETTLTTNAPARPAVVAPPVANSAAPAARIGAEDTLANSLGRLIAISENYPDLKTDSAFQNLQHQLTETEDRIAASRRLYNGNVRGLNTAIETVPTNLIANTIGGFVKAEYFETTDSSVLDLPSVSF